MKSSTLHACALVLFLVLGLIGCRSDEVPSLPNVVLILADDMGYGDPGSYNHESRIPTPNIDRLGLSTDPGAWTAVGNWQSQVGGGDWDNANGSTAMTPLGGGIYQFSAVLAPGTYEGKAVVSGSWDSISWDGRSVNTANSGFTTDAVNDTVVFTVDAFTGTSKVEVIPEPSSIALIAAGGFAVMFLRRFRK